MSKRGDNRRRAQRSRQLWQQRQPTGNADPRRFGGSIAGPGGSHDRGAVVLDMTDCVLLDTADVCTIDTVTAGRDGGQAIYMTLSGRINKTTDRTQIGYVFGPDGAAALITELLALADRFGPELLTDMTTRLTALAANHNIDLAWLRAAIDTADEATTDG